MGTYTVDRRARRRELHGPTWLAWHSDSLLDTPPHGPRTRPKTRKETRGDHVVHMIRVDLFDNASGESKTEH
jgi:hypothetical protein